MAFRSILLDGMFDNEEKWVVVLPDSSSLHIVVEDGDSFGPEDLEMVLFHLAHQTHQSDQSATFEHGFRYRHVAVIHYRHGRTFGIQFV